MARKVTATAILWGEGSGSFCEKVALEGFVLRRYQSDDAPALAVAVSESLEHLRPWMPWIALEPTTLNEREKLIAQWDRDWIAGTQYSFGMFCEARVVGGAGLMARIAKGGFEIGYWVHPKFARRGFATDAAEALTTLAFSLPGTTHVEIHHDRENPISGRKDSASRWSVNEPSRPRHQARVECTASGGWTVPAGQEEHPAAN